MDYNNTEILVGKVRKYDVVTGEIISDKGDYMFTQDSISEDEMISLNDTVLFRGEEVHGVRVAYFIKKLSPNEDLNQQIYIKTKRIKCIKENE